MPTVVTAEKVPGSVLNVDADFAAYNLAGNDDTSPGQARQNVRTKVDAFLAVTGADKVRMHLTAGESHKGHRFLISTVRAYQGQRKGNRKPKNWQALRTWMETYTGELYKFSIMTTREADDSMGLVSALLPWDKNFIATADKDMRMLPGIHVDWSSYRLVKLKPDVFRLDDNELIYGPAWFWHQMLQGDTADNIPGLETHKAAPRGQVGEKTAALWLAGATNNKQAFGLVAERYEDTYGKAWGERFAEQAMLLWLRRDREADMGDFLKGLNITDRAVKAGVKAIRERVAAQLAEAAELMKLSGQQEDLPPADEKAPPRASRKPRVPKPAPDWTKPPPPFSWPVGIHYSQPIKD